MTTTPTDDGTPGPPRRWPFIGVGALVLAVAVAVALIVAGDDDEKAPDIPLSTTTSVAGVSPENPPQLHNTGDDFAAIFNSLNDFQNWVFQHDPDPKWAESTMDPRCECYATTQAGLASLKSKGHRHSGPGVRVNRVEVRDRLSPDQVTLYVVLEGLPDSIVDPSGRVVQTAPLLPATGFLEELVRGSDGRWRVLQVTTLSSPSGGGS